MNFNKNLDSSLFHNKNIKMNRTYISKNAHGEPILLKSGSKTNNLENISFPLKSFTTKDTYNLSIDVDKNKKKFIVSSCNCGIKFGRSLRTSCKHIDKISKMSFNKMIKTYEKSLIKESIHEIIDKVPIVNNFDFDIDDIDNNSENNENKLYIHVKSSISNEEYKIFVDEKFILTCTCGMQFGLNFRKKCKHIDHISKLSLIEIQGLLINNPDKIDELMNTLVI
jgi:hypothetical protein